MALVEISGAARVLVRSDGSKLRLTYGLIGTGKARAMSTGSWIRLLYGPLGSSKLLVTATGIFDDVAPVASVSVLGTQSLRVNFSEPMLKNLALETPANYVFTPVGAGAALTCLSATAENAVAPTYVDLSITEMTDGEDYQLVLDATIVDLHGSSTEEPATFTGLGAAPEISSALAVTATKVRVTFNESMFTTDGELENPENYSIEPTEAGAVSVAVQDVERGVLSTTIVDLICTEMTDGKAYKIIASNVRDAALNPVESPTNEKAFTGTGERPTVLRVESISENRMNIVFSEQMKNNAELRDASRYTWDQGLSTLDILEIDEDTVKLVTSDQEPGLLYTLTISNP